MSESHGSKPASSAAGVLREAQDPRFEADFADLAARFAAKSGGGLAPELSADLALEIVLNEIVEQACQATHATGAAIVVEREGEMICRASAGATAPELGSRLDTLGGLSGECLRTRRTQWCDDVLNDPRADAAASQRLGVRSVVVMPMLGGDRLLGVFELFSTQPYAFGVRDERTLETLADRTLTTLQRACRALEAEADGIHPASDLPFIDHQFMDSPFVDSPSVFPPIVPQVHFANADVSQPDLPPSDLPDVVPPQIDLSHLDLGREFHRRERPRAAAAHETGNGNAVRYPVDLPRPTAFPAEPIPTDSAPTAKNAAVAQGEVAAVAKRASGLDFLTWALAAAVVVAALLLGAALERHLVFSQAGSVAHASNRVAEAAGKPNPQPSGTTSGNTSASGPAAAATGPANPGVTGKPSPNGERVPPGGLIVFENGKEVFRLPPTKTADDPGAASSQTESVPQPATDQTAPQQSAPAQSAPAQPAPDQSSPEQSAPQQSSPHQTPEQNAPQPNAPAQTAPAGQPAAGESQRVVEVPEALAERQLLRRVQPAYPLEARQQNVQGPVVLELHVRTDGSVGDVQVVSGPALLAQASTNAVKQWKFRPQVVNGSPVEMQTTITLDFTSAQ